MRLQNSDFVCQTRTFGAISQAIVKPWIKCDASVRKIYEKTSVFSFVCISIKRLPTSTATVIMFRFWNGAIAWCNQLMLGTFVRFFLYVRCTRFPYWTRFFRHYATLNNTSKTQIKWKKYWIWKARNRRHAAQFIMHIRHKARVVHHVGS